MKIRLWRPPNELRAFVLAVWRKQFTQFRPEQRPDRPASALAARISRTLPTEADTASTGKKGETVPTQLELPGGV